MTGVGALQIGIESRKCDPGKKNSEAARLAATECEAARLAATRCAAARMAKIDCEVARLAETSWLPFRHSPLQLLVLGHSRVALNAASAVS